MTNLTPTQSNPILLQYKQVCSEIRAAEKRAGRAEGSATLVAVSKTFSAEEIEPILAAGHQVFGENRVQEAQAKWPGLRAQYEGVELHLIGPLQTNKAREAVRLFDVIETLDRPKLAHALKAAAEHEGRMPRLFVQVNTGEEPQKAGIAPHEVEAFLKLVRDELALPVEGLMCIPPADQAPSPHFALLAKIAAQHNLPNLSMGMSADFATAVALGATHVRVGSAIFGNRAAIAQ